MQLLLKIRFLIFCAPNFIWPFERIKIGWKVKSRKLDKIILYDGIKKTIINAIAQVEIKEEHNQK